jgi:hypothetical protein
MATREGTRRVDRRRWADRKWQVLSHATARRVELLQTLAPDRRCRGCGVRKRNWDALTIDHMDGRDWDPAKFNRWSRIARYWREYNAGVRLQALCLKCNGKDGQLRQTLAAAAARYRRAA